MVGGFVGEDFAESSFLVGGKIGRSEKEAQGSALEMWWLPLGESHSTLSGILNKCTVAYKVVVLCHAHHV